MSFLHPGLLALAALAPLELLVARLRLGPLRASVEALSGPRNRGRASRIFTTASTCGSVSGALFIVFAALSLAGPSWGSRGSTAERSGLEAVFVLDVSRSMLAADVPPSRLEAAKALIRGLIHGDGLRGTSGSASFALVAVKGDGILLSPMTEDVDALDGALDYADPETMTAPGTDLERGLQAGLEAFSRTSAADRVLVLLSDGGELSGSIMDEVQALRQIHVRFAAVGFGGSVPAPVPGPDGSPLLMPSGLPVQSALESTRMRDLASAVGGRYLDGSDAGTSASLAAELAEARRGGTKVEIESVDRSGFAAFLALVFLVAALVADMLSTSGAAWKARREAEGGGAS